MQPGFTSATYPIPLPKPEPRAVREHFVVPLIGSREVARAQRSGVRHCEDALKALDFGNGLLGVHSVPISDVSVAIVKRSAGCKRLHLRIAPEFRPNRILDLVLQRIPCRNHHPNTEHILKSFFRGCIAEFLKTRVTSTLR
jgi:hypothetical protein